MRRLPILAMACLLTGCVVNAPMAPAPAPWVMPFADGSNWVLTRSMTYRLGDSEHYIVVPAGFVTDMSSVPKIAWAFAYPTEIHGRAGVVHDWLYWQQGCSQPEADKIMLLAMIELEVSPFKRETIYKALQLAGHHAFKDNGEQKAAGMPRIVPIQQIEEIPPLAGWIDYRRDLQHFQRIGPTEVDYASEKPAYCTAVDELIQLELAKRRS